jgi:hypothetical protein
VLFMLCFLVLLSLVLAVVLWGATQFGQSYFYTEPASGLLWRAPAAAGILTFFYLLWSLLNYAGGNPANGDLPYPVLWRFSNRIYMVDSPVPEFTSKTKNTEPTLFKLDKTQLRGTNYKQAEGPENWSARGVEWISLKHDGKEYKFESDKTYKEAGGGYARFVDKENGWEMREIEIGQPSHTSSFRLLVYFCLNVLHLIVWVAVVWLVLRFSLPHAVLLAFLMWLAFTLMMLPLLFGNVQSAVRPVTPVAWLLAS